MERINMNVTEISIIEKQTNFNEEGLEINCESDKDISEMETLEVSVDSSDALVCVDSDDEMEEYSSPVKEILSSSKKMDISYKKQLMETMNSTRINEALLKDYISKVYPEVKSTNSKNLKADETLDRAENGTESSLAMLSLNGSGIENGRPPTIDLDKDLQQIIFPKSNQVHDSSSEDRLVRNSSPLPEAFHGLVQKLKDILQKIEELFEAMDSRPHWNRLVGKSNSPWKLNSTVEEDSDIPTDKKPKILKQWTDTRLKFSRLSASLKELIHPCLSSSQVVKFLADVKSTILQCIDFNKVQDCSNLTENIQTIFEADSDDRYMFNLKRRILIIEVTLRNITFEVDRISEDYENDKEPQMGGNVESE